MLYPLGRASLGSGGASVSNLKPLVLVELFAAANKADVRDQSPKGRRSLLEIARSIGAK